MNFLFKVLCFVASVSAVFGTESIEARNIVSDGIKNYILKFQKQMPCGFPEYDLPPLAPWHIPRYAITLNLNSFSAVGLLTDNVAEHLNDFTIQRLDFNMITWVTDVHMIFPSTFAHGLFSNLVGRSLDSCFVNGNGRFSGRINNLHYIGQAHVSLRGGTLHVNRLISSISISSAQSNINSFVGTAAQSEACNRQLERELPRVLRENQSTINNMISDMILPIINPYVNQMTFADLLAIISVKDPWPPCIV